jgi:hypothetical protein
VDLAKWVQRVLRLDIERACPESATVYRAEQLNVAYRVDPEVLRDPLLHDRKEFVHSLLGVLRIDEVEVTSLNQGQIRHLALVDPVRIGDDPALGGLAEDVGQAHNRHPPETIASANTCPGPTDGS